MKFHQIKWKLLITYLAVVAVCIGVVVVITRQLTINSYNDHVNRMAEFGMGRMMSGGMANDLNTAIRDALNISLVWAGLIAVGVAVVMSVLIARRITSPIPEMAAVTEKIAEGDYSQRVRPGSRDEIGSLAQSLNRMAVSLDESRRLRRELMANIAHELRTPLTSISGYMEGLADGVVPASPEVYELVHTEAARLSRLVDDLQRLSRAESGQEVLDIVALPVTPFLERVVRKMVPPFQKKGVELELAADADLPQMMADEDKMDQVVVNLLDNALRYSDAGGTVTLAARKSGDQVVMDVADSGIGIASEDLPHVFERFYRADKSRSREKGGSGIGLTIAKCYVESLGGTINVSSQPGKGSTFTVALPAEGAKP
jgi:histidine kinase